MANQRKDLILEKVKKRAEQLNHTVQDYKRGHGTPKSKLTMRCHKCQTAFDTNPALYLKEKEPCSTCVQNPILKEEVVDPLEKLHGEDPDQLSMDVDNTFVVPEEFLVDLQQTVVNKEDLNLIKYTLSGSVKPYWFLEMNRDNEYFKHIEACRKKGYTNLDKTQKHHTIPRHFFGDDASVEEQRYCESPENIIPLLVPDHILAHTLLFGIYGRPVDICAVNMLNKQFDKVGKLVSLMGAHASHQKQKILGVGFYNKKKQEELHIAKHWEKLFKCSDVYDWYFHGKFVVTITGLGTTGQVIKKLNEFHPAEMLSLSRLINGENKSCEGWTCIKKN